MNERHNESGMTLIEALVVALIVAVVISATGLSILNWVQSERRRGAVYNVYLQLSRARMEAVNRNRPCRFLIDTAARTAQVIDLNDTSTSSDDEEISLVRFERGVVFDRPDAGSAITLDLVSGSTFEAVFAQDGSLASGVGGVAIEGGGRFHRVSVYGGGGIQVERWNGTTWAGGM